MVARYTQGPGIDEPMVMLRGANSSYYHQDRLGTVTSLSDISGSTAQTYSFDSFGQQTASSGSLSNPFRYTGREFDTETGLYYYRARYYSPETGRFLGEDPIRFHAGVNFYAYVGNNPAIYVDPTGTLGIIDTIVNWISPPPADPALVKLPPPTSPPILSTDMAGHAAQGGSTTFYPGGDASPYSINTRTTVDSKWLRDHPGAGDAYCGSTAYVFYRGYDTPGYGPNGAQINTGDPRLRWIHGGRDKGSGSTLWPTNGCTRGHDQDVIDLGQLITEYQQNHPGMPITYCRR